MPRTPVSVRAAKYITPETDPGDFAFNRPSLTIYSGRVFDLAGAHGSLRAGKRAKAYASALNAQKEERQVRLQARKAYPVDDLVEALEGMTVLVIAENAKPSAENHILESRGDPRIRRDMTRRAGPSPC